MQEKYFLNYWENTQWTILEHWSFRWKKYISVFILYRLHLKQAFEIFGAEKEKTTFLEELYFYEPHVESGCSVFIQDTTCIVG